MAAPVSQKAKLAAAVKEHKQALEQQAATAEILHAISRSPGDARPVFETILDKAHRLCGAAYTVLYSYDGTTVNVLGSRGMTAKGIRVLRSNYPQTPKRDKLIGRAVLEAKLFHTDDINNDPRFPSATKALPRRTVIAVPLVRGKNVLGAISCGRVETRAFSKDEIRLLKTFADQAVIAIDNARLFNETKEALERQTATGDILASISSSVEDAQPVFDAIVRNLRRLFGTAFSAVFLVRGDKVEVAALEGEEHFVSGARQAYPLSLEDEDMLAVRVIRRAQVLRVCPIVGNPEAPAKTERLARTSGYNSIMVAPMMREGRAIGAIATASIAATPFDDRQVALIKSFADQAVIAIENARLFNETKEALEQQTATAEILKVIAGSPTDVQPVFDVIVESAVRLCGARFGRVYRYDGSVIEMVASHGLTSAGLGQVQRVFPRPAADNTTAGLAILTRRPYFIKDIAREDTVPALSRQMMEAIGTRSQVTIPMLRAGAPIGVLTMGWDAPAAFNDSQVALLQTFADQAVIAIENVRLFNETKEALEQQTATSEVLKTISRSTFDLNAVLQVLIENATRLAGASRGFIFRFDGQVARLAFSFNAPPAYAALIEANPIPPGRGSLVGRTLVERRPVHIVDVLADGEFTWHEAQRLGGFRSMLGVPMMREGNLVGVIAMWSDEVKPFTDKQIALVSTFADQAVIAIENVRLFNETKEALERQTASAEILRVISSTPTDTQPVFDAIVDATQRLIAGKRAGLFLRRGSQFVMVANSGTRIDDLPDETRIVPLDRRHNFPSRAILDGEVVHVTDWEGDGVPEFEKLVGKAHGIKSGVIVPLLRKGEGIGALAVVRTTVGPYQEQEIALLRSFADQAVIAIENVRLFNETREALERQTATAEILQVIGSSPTDTQPVFDAIVNSGVRLFPGAMITVARPDGGTVRAAAIAHEDTTMVAGWRERFTTPLSRDRLHAAAILDAKLIDFPDAQAERDGALGPGVRNFLLSGNRAVTIMPMLRGAGAIGAISVTRAVPGRLSDRQIAILRTFADQAVIAIENVRLFNETKEALEQQTATADILKVISSSPTETQPVFEAIVQSAARLFAPSTAVIAMREGDTMMRRARAGVELVDQAAAADIWPLPFDPDRSMAARSIIERVIIEIPDTEAENLPAIVKRLGKAAGYRAITLVPLLREGEGIGVIALTRPEPGVKLTEKQLALVRTFADQAVIAIENVRLFKELQARTEALTKSVGQLTALGEVGQAISSTLDLETVLKTIAARAVQLTGLDSGSIYEYDEQAEEYHLRATENLSDEIVEMLRRVPIRRNEGPVWEAGVTGQPTQVAEMRDETYQTPRRNFLLRAGYRALLAVPLMRENRIVGALTVTRKAPGAFAPEVVELLKTFASQSVLAIQNARLFREIAEKGKQLEVASQHKSQFLASMSHELRTPLNALLGFNEMLLGDIYGEVPGDMRPPLAQMQSSGKHLLRLINNVLDLAKIEAGRMELALAEYSVHDTVESVRSTLQPLAAEKGLDFLAAVPAEIPLAYGDPGRITQCLMNLAGNSLKFTRAGKVEISVAMDNGLLRYRIVDTGIGIPADKIGGLFTEFKQTDATVASEYGGTGLGLSISKKFVEMHGGRIWAESEPGKGSVFTFEVPLRASAP